jgi:hypothetical protein
MSTKMGRPKLPKNRARGVLVGARFSSPEAKTISRAAIKSDQGKSEWIRRTLLWAAQREDVKSDKWSAKDLDGQTVDFKMVELPNAFVRGTGKFLALQRGDGSMDLRIITRNRLEADPLAFNDIPVSQRGVDLLERSPAGSECAFSLIDSDVP